MGRRGFAPWSITLLQLALAGSFWAGARQAASTVLMVAACGVCALPAGMAVAVTGKRLRGAAHEQGSGMLLADTWGAAAGGLFFTVLLLPCLGGGQALLLVSLLAAGVSACTTVSASQTRFAAAVACLACLLSGAWAWQADWASGRLAPVSDTVQTVPAATPPSAPPALRMSCVATADAPAGIARPIDPERFQQLWSSGQLSRQPADFWEAEPAD